MFKVFLTTLSLVALSCFDQGLRQDRSGFAGTGSLRQQDFFDYM